MDQRDSMRCTALFCLGLGASNAWWLSVTSSPLVWSSSPLGSGLASLIVHASYLIVQIACVVAASLRPLSFAHRRTFFASAALCTAGTAVLTAAVFFGLPPVCIVVGRVAASCGGALLFLCWMSPFTALIGRKVPGSVFLLATVCGTVIWFVTTRVDAVVATVSLLALPLVSGAAILGIPSSLRTPATGEMPARRAARIPLRTLFPAAFVLGLFAYELPVGFVTGTASRATAEASGAALFQIYAIYTVVIALVAAADYALARHERCSNLLHRFVVPIISIGLIALALARTQDQVLASALVLAGTILFEMFVMTSFARISLSARETPWRIFGFGGAVLQAALLASFFLGLFLADAASAWLAAIALGLVFVLILAGSFDIPGKGLMEGSPEALGAHGGKDAAARCERFAQVHGLSAREAEVLALIARGRSVQAVADELYVAHSTVKTHIGHIYEKTGVSNRQDLLKLLDGFNG
ncbi:LuxR C-terminal-related transcriptional regulator [Arabiibacter massiliensis]|uniref:LuxR C-terminal-related transcriptional regulator n=1 Tax=Arabiibacter massiliensis TaxID=1870985 RepID=UPI00117B91A8|nr:helix-turn-helix transcriptional regulator [Arabiibacter massiliensis]